MAFLTAIFFGFVPMFFFAYIFYWLDRYEKEPLILLAGVFSEGRRRGLPYHRMAELVRTGRASHCRPICTRRWRRAGR